MLQKRYNTYRFISFMLTFLIVIYSESSMSSEKALDTARELFYQSVEDDNKIEDALSLFNKLYNEQGTLPGRALTYIGTLYTLKGKHAILPHTKLKWVIKGLDIMDQGLALNPNDIETLFIHASTCHFLPFFFNRKDDAQRHFKHIISLLPSQLDKHEPELLINVIKFIEKHGDLEEDQKASLSNFKNLLGNNEN